MAIAAVRASAEQTIAHDGRQVGVVRGRRVADGKEVALFPGRLPEDAAALLGQAGAGAPGAAPALWNGADFARPSFAPPRWSAGGPGNSDGPPHIRLDRAIEFLIGDRLE
jgi:predicted YcjX-like family ATPase